MKKWMFVFVLFLAGCSTSSPVLEPQSLEQKQLLIQTSENTLQILVEIADSPEEHRIGLMHRSFLKEDEGMWFDLKTKKKYAFWMKNTLIPLDMIHVDENGVIVNVIHAEPCKTDPCPRYPSEKEALYVLEVNKGFAEKNGISIGDQVVIP